MVYDAVIFWGVITEGLANHLYKRLALQPMNLFGIQRNKMVLEKLKKSSTQVWERGSGRYKRNTEERRDTLSLLLEWGD